MAVFWIPAFAGMTGVRNNSFDIITESAEERVRPRTSTSTERALYEGMESSSDSTVYQ